MSSFLLPYQSVGTPGVVSLVEEVNANFLALQTEISNGTIFSGYPTVINATSSPYLLSPNNTGAENDTALQAAINALITQPGPGGTIFIPAGVYQFDNGVALTGHGKAIIIEGSGGYTQLQMPNPNNNLFTFTNFSNGGHDGGGCRIRNLWIEFTGSPSSGSGSAISIAGGQCITAEECFFLNCPYVMNDGGTTDSLKCGLRYCTMQNLTVPSTWQVYMGGIQVYVDHCVILGASPPAVMSGGIYLTANEAYVYATSIEQMANSVFITSGAQFIHFMDCNIKGENWAVKIQPTTGLGSIFEVYFTNCTMGPGNQLLANFPGVYVDSNMSAMFQGFYFTQCSVWGWNGPGLQINNAQIVRVTGGQYSGNGQSPTSVSLGAGIAITADATDVLIQGVNLSGANAFYGNTTIQPYGLSVTSSLVTATVDNCNFNSPILNSVGPLYVAGLTPPSSLFVRNSQGYNNPISKVATIANLPASGALWSPQMLGSASYFGDWLLSLAGSGITNVGYNSIPTEATIETGLSGGIFPFKAWEQVILSYSPSATGVSLFNVIGQ